MEVNINIMGKKLGHDFEQAVAKVQSLFAPDAEILTNEKIVDRLGHSREFDVTIRSKAAGFDILGVIECKDLSRPVGLEIVESFNTKASDANAHIKVIVSRKGFTKTAIEKAKHYNISTLSLLPQDKSNYDMGLHITANIYWINELSLSLCEDFPFYEQAYDVYDVLLNGMPIIDWYKNYILDNYSDKAETGNVMGVEVVFKTTQLLEIKGQQVGCKSVLFSANRAVKVKSKNIPISGDGFFDWRESKLLPQPDGSICISLTDDDLDFESWPSKSTKDNPKQSGFIINVMNKSIDYVPDAIQLQDFGLTKTSR